ncbi:MAG: MAPEG family protein [Gammaproteobacteria bacterium]|nr:MAPEG family protein [Gammaproteobacteria bacterium]
MEAIAIITILALMQAYAFAIQVGQARTKHGVKAPDTSGHEDFDRMFRIHQNTMEQLIVFIPALWIFGLYVHALAGAGIGLVFVIGRFIYRGAYLKDPASRGLGFGLGAIAMAILMLGGLIGAAMSYMAG